VWWTWIVVAVSVAYLVVLFAIASYGDRRADAGRSLINSGTIYAQIGRASCRERV